MRKKITALLAAGIMLLQSAPLSALAGLIEVAPGNMVFLDVQYPDGSSAAGVTVTLHNAAGTEVGGIINDRGFFESNDSGIDGTELGDDRYCYYVPWNTFTPYVAPQTLHSVNIWRTDLDGGSYEIYANEPVFVNGGMPYKIRLYSYDASQATALTVPANQFAVYVDAKWANRTVGAYIKTPSLERYINYAPLTGILADALTLKPGTTNLIEAFDPNYSAGIGLVFSDESGGFTSANEITVSSAATEYVLCRLPLRQLCSSFQEDGTVIRDGLLYDLRQDTAYTSALLTIQSGAVINVVIPDSSGYVEFYLDRATRKFTLDYCYDFHDVPIESGSTAQGGGGFSDSGVAANLTEYYLEALQPPLGEIVLTQVPAGTYTLTYENLPDGYEAPKTTTLTVTDSQEVQYLQLVLEKASLLGDVDENGTVNAADAALLLKAASLVGSGGASGLNADQEKSADVNGDGVYNASDAALILQYAAYVGSGGTMTLEAYLAERTTS